MTCVTCCSGQTSSPGVKPVALPTTITFSLHAGFSIGKQTLLFVHTLNTCGFKKLLNLSYDDPPHHMHAVVDTLMEKLRCVAPIHAALRRPTSV